MKKRIKDIYIFIALILIGSVFALYWFLGPSVSFYKENHVLERTNKYNPYDFIFESRGNVIPEKEYLDTEEVGLHEFHYTVSRWGLSKDIVFYYEVTDTVAPLITIQNRLIEIEPYTVYGDNEVLKNVSINEGELQIESNLDIRYAGDYYVNVIAADKYGNTSSDSYTVLVKDHEKPFLLETGDGALVRRWSHFDVNDVISYGDNVDPDPKLTVEGYVNTNYLGKYPIHATLTDASGNSTSWSFTVEVVSTMPSYEEDDEYYDFDDFIDDYKIEGRKVGIDVSEWQDDIDFNKVKKAGCEFVMMRIGFAHDGVLTLDKEFKANIRKAKEVGLPVGIYYYSHDKSEEEVLSVLDQIFKELDGESLELPIVFDWENFLDYQNYHISFHDLNKLYDVFEKEVKAHGYEPMLYGSRFYLTNVWRNTEKRPIWLAHYTYWSNYEGPYRIWQRCSWGKIDGIDPAVDFDVMFIEDNKDSE